MMGRVARIWAALLLLGSLAWWDSRLEAQARRPEPPRTEAEAEAGERTAGEPVVAYTELSRTAVWPGDQVTYTIELIASPGVDIITEDLAREKLRLDGFELRTSSEEVTAMPDGSTRRLFKYDFAVYDTERPEARVGVLAVRYYRKRPGQRIEDVTAEGEIRLAPAVSAIRSTLEDTLADYRLRDHRDAAIRPPWTALLQPIGIAFILVSIAPVAIWGVALAQRAAKGRRGRGRRAARHSARATLEEIKGLSLDNEMARREVCSRLDTLLREHLERSAGVGAPALTPNEIEGVLQNNGSRLPLPVVSSLLREFELARYGGPGHVPPEDNVRAAIERTEEVMTTHR
jgi:hypothetical protein